MAPRPPRAPEPADEPATDPATDPAAGSPAEPAVQARVVAQRAEETHLPNHRPTDDSAEQLGFRKAKMVHWLVAPDARQHRGPVISPTP